MRKARKVNGVTGAPSKEDATFSDTPCRPRQKAHHGEAGHRFSGPGFANERDGLAGMNLQVHAKDWSNGAGLGVKGNLEIGDFQERRRCVGQGVTSL